MGNFGFCYQGSKSAIAADIVGALPSADVFVDLFCGGCAVTHAAILSGKYKRFIVNDCNPLAPKLFVDAIKGKYRNAKLWISREAFNRLKEKSGYVRWCWSFSAGGKQYLYSREIEPYKKALHQAIVFCDFEPMRELTGWDLSRLAKCRTANERRLAFRGEVLRKAPNVEKRGSHYYAKRQAFEGAAGQQIDQLQSLESLERLERLERLQSLESLAGRIEIHSGDYRAVEIPKGAVVYCDPPYKGAAGYCGAGEFDYDAFYDFVEATPNCFASEYEMPSDRFKVIWAAKKRPLMRGARTGGGKENGATERLYAPVKCGWNCGRLFDVLAVS